MFDILMYLFENYIHSEMEVVVDHDELTNELTRAGFREQEIQKALAWLERLADLQELETKSYIDASATQATRIYSQLYLSCSDVCRWFPSSRTALAGDCFFTDRQGVRDYAENRSRFVAPDARGRLHCRDQSPLMEWS